MQQLAAAGSSLQQQQKQQHFWLLSLSANAQIPSPGTPLASVVRYPLSYLVKKHDRTNDGKESSSAVSRTVCAGARFCGTESEAEECSAT